MDDFEPTLNSVNYRPPENIDGRKASPELMPQRTDVTQMRQPRDEQLRPVYSQPVKSAPPRRPDVPDDVEVPHSTARQRSLPQHLVDGPTYPYQNGFVGDDYDKLYGVGHDSPEVTRRQGPTEAQPVKSAPPKRPDVPDDLEVPHTSARQRSPRQDLVDGPTYPYQNGFIGDDYPDVRGRQRPTEAQRPVIVERRQPVDSDLRYRSSEEVEHRNKFDERVDTPQSGRLSQSAMMVRELYEDGEFDQEVSVSRGSDIFALFR